MARKAASRRTKIEAARHRLQNGGELRREIADRLGIDPAIVNRLAEEIRESRFSDYDYRRRPSPYY